MKMKINLNDKEKEFLKEKSYVIKGDYINGELAEIIVDDLGWNDYGTACDIITKITTKKDW